MQTAGPFKHHTDVEYDTEWRREDEKLKGKRIA